MSNRFIQVRNGKFELLCFDNDQPGRPLNLTCDNSARSPNWILGNFELSNIESHIITTRAGSPGAIIQSTSSAKGFDILVLERGKLQRYFLDKPDKANFKIEKRGTVSEACIGFNSFIQSRPNLETDSKAHGNFEAVVLEKEGLVHYRLVNALSEGTWRRCSLISGNTTAPGCIIQSTLGMGRGNPGNLEAVILENNNLVHYYLDNSKHFETPEWIRGEIITSRAQDSGCIIQRKLMRNDVLGEFEVVVPEEGNLVHYGRDNSQGLVGCGYWSMRGIVATDVSGPAALIQSSVKTPSGVGRFEVVVEEKDEDGQPWLVHYWKDPMNSGFMWEVATDIKGVH